MASVYDGASPEGDEFSDKSKIKNATGAASATGDSRRSFLKGVVGGAVVAGIAAGAAGYYLRSPTISPTSTTESNSVTTTGTLTSPGLGKQLLVGSGFPETGLFAGDGLSGIKSSTMAFEDWVAIYGSLPNRSPSFKFINIDVPDKNTQQASAAIKQLFSQDNVDLVLTDYITVDATEEDEAAKYDHYYINHDITGLHERKVLLHDTYAGTLPAAGDIKWQSYNGFPSYDMKVPAQYPKHNYWNVFMGVVHDEDYSRNLFMNYQGWIDHGKHKPINKKYAVFEIAGAYGQRIAHTFEVMMGLAGYKNNFKKQIDFGTVEYGTMLAQLKSDPPDLIFYTDFAPSDEAAFLKQFMQDPLPSLIFFQYGPSLPDFLPLAKGDAVGALFHECRGLLRNSRGYDYEAHYWKRWNSAPALADSAQSQDFAWNSLTVGGMAGGFVGDNARRMSAILNSSVDERNSDYVTVGLGGPWSMRPGQMVRAWPFEQFNLDLAMGGPIVTYQVKNRVGETPPADGDRTTKKPYTRPGNVPTRILIGSEKASSFWFDPAVIAKTNFNETQDTYWSPVSQAVMKDDPKAFYTSGQYAWSTDGIQPNFADETFEEPAYFANVSATTKANIKQ
jgi:branched-chain amino acid transport system substrate-binding protein